MAAEENEKRDGATEPKTSEEEMRKMTLKALSFEVIMSVAMDHLLERGYQLAQGPRGEFMVEHRSRPGMSIRFSTALAFEADAWFRKQAELAAARSEP